MEDYGKLLAPSAVWCLVSSVAGWSAYSTPTSTFHGFVAHEPLQTHHLEFDLHEMYSRQSEIVPSD